MAFFKQEFVDGVTVATAAWLNGIQEVVGAAAVAPEYSSEQIYAEGALASHDGQLYICNTTIASPEEWTSQHWTATSLQALVSEQKGVFWCTYQITPYGQIAEAISKSKYPICPYDFTSNGVRYRGTAFYAYAGSGEYVFFDCYDDGTYVKLIINSESAWSNELLNPLVPSGRTVNDMPLSADIEITAEDVPYDDALAEHEAGSVGYEIDELKNAVEGLETEVSDLDGIFWVTDGVTTSAEIDEALSDGKYPILKTTELYPTIYMPFLTGEEQINITQQGMETVYSYIFQAIRDDGKCYLQVLEKNSTTGVETWGNLTDDMLNKGTITTAQIDSLYA